MGPARAYMRETARTSRPCAWRRTLMPQTNQRGVRLAQIALDAYYEGRQAQRRGGVTASGCDWSESDMVDLMTDLMLLARSKNHDLSALLRKVEAHIRAETGREC